MTNKKRNSLTKDEIIKRLIDHHTNWCKQDGEDKPFNYSYIRQKDPRVISAIDRNVMGARGLAGAFELAGIDPLCHLKGILYGKTENIKIQKKQFLNVLYHLAIEVGSPENLNDSTINSGRSLILHDLHKDNKEYPACAKHNCQLLPVTFRSIYAEGRRLYGDWGTALKAAGFNYEDIRRKKPKYTREEVMGDLMQFFKESKSRWSAQAIRKNNLALYKGIYNSHKQSPFLFANRPVIETAIIELQYHLKKETLPGLTPEIFYRDRKGIKA